MREITAYNEDNFREVEQYEGLSVIRFSATWCPPCQSSEPFFTAFTDHLEEDIKVGKVNVDQAPVLTAKYEIWGLPSVLIFRQGQLVARIPGVKSSAFYAAALEDAKKSNNALLSS